MTTKKKEERLLLCLDDSVHHYQQIVDYSITGHTLGWIGGMPPPLVPAKPHRFICIKCGNVITV